MKIIPIIICEDIRWKNDASIEAIIKKASSAVFDYFQKFSFLSKIEFTILLSNDEEIKEFNSQYRNQNKATNVLSFPQINGVLKDTPEIIKNLITNEQGVDTANIGDIILSFDTIQKEASEERKLFSQHVAHLIIHGVLHLLGFDHQTGKDADEMEKVEVAILEKIGIANPYVESL